MNMTAPKILNLNDKDFSFAEISKKVQEWMVKTKTTKDIKVFVTLKTFPKEGLKAFFNRLNRSKEDLENVRFLFLLENVPECVQTELFYLSCFKNDCRVSVFQNGSWGTYLEVPENALQENGPLSNTIIAAKLSK